MVLLLAMLELLPTVRAINRRSGMAICPCNCSSCWYRTPWRRIKLSLEDRSFAWYHVCLIVGSTVGRTCLGPSKTSLEVWNLDKNDSPSRESLLPGLLPRRNRRLWGSASIGSRNPPRRKSGWRRRSSGIPPKSSNRRDSWLESSSTRESSFPIVSFPPSLWNDVVSIRWCCFCCCCCCCDGAVSSFLMVSSVEVEMMKDVSTIPMVVSSNTDAKGGCKRNRGIMMMNAILFLKKERIFFLRFVLEGHFLVCGGNNVYKEKRRGNKWWGVTVSKLL